MGPGIPRASLRRFSEGVPNDIINAPPAKCQLAFLRVKSPMRDPT